MSRRQNQPRVIKPTFFVFCEGESEEAYISYLRSKYRIPMEIKAKVARNKINQEYIRRILQPLLKHKKDKYFLLYDLDVPEMLPKLQSMKNTILLASNPCLELWFLLHTCNHSAEVTSEQCVSQLEGIVWTYKKGFICDKLKRELESGEDIACTRASRLVLYNNPSTSVYRFIEELKKV